VTFLPDGKHAVCATPGGVYRFDGTTWVSVSAPREATPARAVLSGADPGRLYLIGRRDLFESTDGGLNWARAQHDIPGEPEFTELAVSRAPAETMYAVVDGQLMSSSDAGLHWVKRTVGTEGGRVSGLSLDSPASRLWIAVADRIYRSSDGGAAWAVVGNRLPEPGISVRGITADPAATALIVATHIGLFRSADGGNTWALLEDNLPVHLEVRPLVTDPGAPGTVYAGFALMPYSELWRSALEGGNLLSRVDPVSLAGGLAFLLLLILLGVLGTRWLLRRGDRNNLHSSKT